MSLFNTKDFVTADDFKSIKLNFEYHNKLTDQLFGYTWLDKQTVKFYNNYMAAPRIAYYKAKDKFIFAFTRDGILRYLQGTLGINPTWKKAEQLEPPMCYYKTSVVTDYLLDGLQFIEGWSEVILHSDGSFEVTYSDKKPFTLDLKENKDMIKQWILKYKKIVDSLIKKNIFIPTITGGLDSRCMAAFYRYALEGSRITSYYLKAVKPDGNNRVELGQADVECSHLVADRLGISKRTEQTNFAYSISAIMNENGREFYNTPLNDPSFLYKFIQHAKLELSGNTRGIIKCSIDDLYLQLKHPQANVMRCVLALLLAEDLLDIPLVGTQDTFDKYGSKPYNFYEEYAETIPLAREILDYWGPEFKKEIDDILHGKY